MLNRLFIVIGVLAILAIAGAFLVPRFIDWGQYRDRMQAIAGEVLGTEVAVVGDIEFSLLPQPRLHMSQVRVGAEDAPVMNVAEVEAEFSLVDFLRDRYSVTKLVLVRPELTLKIDNDGQFRAGITLAEEVTTSNVAVASAEIVDGSMTLADERSGKAFSAGNVDGELRMDALRGPFAFQGGGEYQGVAYTTRVTTTTLDEQGAAQLSAFLQPADQSFSLNAEGALTTSGTPSFNGEVTYRRAPQLPAEGEIQDAGQGDLVVSGTVMASPERVLLADYTIIPDENRAGTRLTGAAEVTLGKAQAFNAVISGGVISLPPRDATADQATMPYELIRLLGELPAPAIPGLPGTIGVDITEVDLRAVALRNVRFDASANGNSWEIESFSAELPGGTTLDLAGELSATAGRPEFIGDVKLTTERLDGLAQLWRKPSEGNPLFNVPGSLQARLALVGETLSVSNATLSIDGHAHRVSAEIGFEAATRHLNLRGDFGALDEAQSAELFALLPDITSDGRFSYTFPKGRFDLAAETATLGGVAGRGLAAQGSWEGGVLALDSLVAEDFGGAAFDAKLTVFGSVAKPELSGTANIAVASASSAALASFYNLVRAPQSIRDYLGRSFPADLTLRLDAPSGDGSQAILVTGKAGVADLSIDGTLGLGFARALGGTMAIELDLRSTDAQAMTAQLGLGNVGLVPEQGPMHLVAVLDGMAANSFETTIRVEGGGDSLAFSGNIIASNLEHLSGNGNVRATLGDPTALVESLGAGGVWVPAISGSAAIDFDALEEVRLSEIKAKSGGQPVTGELALRRTGETSAVTGQLDVAGFDPQGLLQVMASPVAAINSGVGFWPDGPLATGDAPRRTTGRIAVTTPAIAVGDTPIVSDARFDLVWDQTNLRLRNFTGALGGGRMTAELGICCSGSIAEKRISGRVALDGVALGSIVPQPVANALSATVNGAVQFDGTGDSLLAALSQMTGEGTYTLQNLEVQRFDPNAFAAIGTLEEILELEPDALTAFIVDRLDDDAFTAPAVSGGFTLAGGVLRSPNLAIEGEGARLFGSTTLRLADLSLGGGYVMSPTTPTPPDALVTQANAQVAANLGGTLQAPERSFDVAGLVDAIMVRAYEIEVARLEQLRAEEEARQREAAQERARVAAEIARQQAEEQAARDAEEAAEAARLAAEEEAARRPEEEAEVEPEQQAPTPAQQTPLPEQSPSFQTLPLNLTPQESQSFF